MVIPFFTYRAILGNAPTNGTSHQQLTPIGMA